jgi:diguanylate cyclase
MQVTMTAVQRLVVGAAAVVACAFATAMVVLPAVGSPAVGAVSNWTQIVVPLLTAVVCLDSSRRQQDRRQRRAWVLYGLGALSWGVGQCVFTWYELVAEVVVPVPSVADLAFVLYPLLGTAAIWLLPVVPRSRTANVRSVLDGLVVASSLVFVVWALSLRLLWASGSGDVPSLVVTTTYVVTDMVLLTMVVLLLPEVGRARRRVLVPVALGTVCFTVADIGYVVVTSATSYSSGEAFDVGWVLGLLGVAVAAVMAHPVPGAGPERARTVSALPSWGTILLPYAPVLAASAVLLWRLGSGSPWTGAESGLAGAVIVLVLVRQLVALADNRSLLAEVSRQHAQARHDSLHDGLTGLANRALFLDRVGHALDRADRNGGRTTVLFCDLDGFKLVNDVHGHAAGDAVLVEVARRLSEQVRTVDCVARLGGDEFAVLLEDPGDPETVVARIDGAMTVPIGIGSTQVRVRTSVGVAQAVGAGDGTDQLVSDADHAMYRVKQARKHREGAGTATSPVRLPQQGGGPGASGSRPTTTG